MRRSIGTSIPGDLSPTSHEVSPYAALEQADRVVLLRGALEHLPATLRTAVLLRDIQELSYQEIATRLKLPEGTVKSRINRGRGELARQIRRLREQHDAAVARAGGQGGPGGGSEPERGVSG